MAIENPNRLHACCRVILNSTADPTIQEVTGRGILNVTRTGSGIFIVLLEQELSYESSFANATKTSNFDSSIVPDATLMVRERNPIGGAFFPLNERRVIIFTNDGLAFADSSFYLAIFSMPEVN